MIEVVPYVIDARGGIRCSKKIFWQHRSKIESIRP